MKNNIRIFDSLAVIELPNMYYTTIDVEDIDIVKNYRWYFNFKKNDKNRGYVVTGKYVDGKCGLIHLHKLILSKDNMLSDHINCNRLDNRKSNLRVASLQENCFNRSQSSTNTSGVTGVSWHKHKKRWYARIDYNGKTYTKYFLNFNDAVLQRKEWEEKYFGEFRYQG